MAFVNVLLLFGVLLCAIYVNGLARDDPYVVTEKQYSWLIGCPVMRVYNGSAAGLFFYEETNDSWVNSYDMLVLTNRAKTTVGPRDSVTYSDAGVPTLGSSYHADAECVYSVDYCSKLTVYSSSACGTGHWTKANVTEWTNEKYPGKKIRSMFPLNADNDRVFGCYDSQNNLIDDSIEKMMKYTCVNDALPEGFKYGYSYVAGKVVYTIGGGAPKEMRYIEGSNYRVFQMETPADGSEVIVYPYSGMLFNDSVAKVTVNSSEGEFPLFPVVRASGNSFRFQLLGGPCQAANGGSRLVNIIQYKVGAFNNYGDKVEVAKVPATDYHKDTTFATSFGGAPQLLGQVIDPNAAYSLHRMWNVSATGFSAYLDKFADNGASQATLGYIAIKLLNKFRVQFFGQNILLTASTNDGNTNVDLSGSAYHDGDTTMSVIDIHRKDSPLKSAAYITSESGSAVSLAIEGICHDAAPIESVSVLSFGHRENPDDYVTDHEEDGCPFYYADVNTNCSGLFQQAGSDLINFEKKNEKNIRLVMEDNTQVCYKDDVEVARGDIAQCALSVKMCTKLAVMNAGCRGDYNYSSPGVWANDTGLEIFYKGRLSNGKMHLGCKQNGTELNLEPLAYVCEISFMAHGLVYGLNWINGEHVAVTGPGRMASGVGYKMFNFDMPNDRSVKVYPMGRQWSTEETVTKITPISTSGLMTIASIWGASRGTFRMELLRSGCKGHAPAERVNVMQFKEGVYVDHFGGGDEMAAGGFGFANSFKAGYYMATRNGNHAFQNVPTLFTQVLRVDVGPEDRFIYSTGRNPTTTNFMNEVQGLDGVDTSGWRGKLGWIAFDISSVDGVKAGRTLLGTLHYSAVYNNVTSDDGLALPLEEGLVEQPLIFTEVLGEAYSYLESASTTAYKMRVAVDDCVDGDNATHSVNSLVIGRTYKKQAEEDLLWAESRSSCGVLQGFGACADSFFVHRHNSWISRNGQRMIWEGEAIGYTCCIEEDFHYDYWYGRSTCANPLESGLNVAACKTGDTICGGLDIVDPAYYGFWIQLDREKYTQEGTDKYIMLEGLADRSFTAVAYGSGGDVLGTISTADITCLRTGEDAATRGTGILEFENFSFYEVGLGLREGPGNGFQTKFDYFENADGIVFYKYFQMELDEQNYYYIRVGGSAWSGNTLAFVTTFANDKDNYLSFEYVYSTSVWAKRMTSACSDLGTARMKANVLLIQEGTHESTDGLTSFTGQRVTIYGSAPHTFTFPDQGMKPTVFMGVVGSGHATYVNPRISAVTSSSVTAYIESSREATLDDGSGATVTLLVVKMSTPVNGTAFLLGRVGKDRAASATVSSPTINSNASDVAISELQFGETPFVLAQLTTAAGTDPALLRFDAITTNNVTLKAEEDGCYDDIHGQESWNILLLGSNARTTIDPSVVTTTSTEPTTTTTTVPTTTVPTTTVPTTTVPTTTVPTTTVPTTTVPTTTVPTTVATTTTIPTTTTKYERCAPQNVNLELFYVQDRSLSFCGVDTCAYAGDNTDRILKSEAIKDKYFDFMEELQSEFRTLKMGYSEFVDKPVTPHGQAGLDYCYKFINSMTEMNADYRSFIEDHWQRTWNYSGSGMDNKENQLDAIIGGVMQGDFSPTDYDAEGKLNLKVLLLVTDKMYHQKGEASCGGSCVAYSTEAQCNCSGVEYPSINDVMDAASAKGVNLIMNVQDAPSTNVESWYSYLRDMLQYYHPNLRAKCAFGGVEAGTKHVLDTADIKEKILETLSYRCSKV